VPFVSGGRIWTRYIYPRPHSSLKYSGDPSSPGGGTARARPGVPVASGGVESGQGTLSGLQNVLSASEKKVFVRAALHSDRQAVRYLDMIVGPPAEPPGWEPRIWEYEGVSFIATQASSRVLASALDPYDAQVLPLGGLALTLPRAVLNCRGNTSRAAPASTQLCSHGRRLSARRTCPVALEGGRTGTSS
jgi:hypothetical protein